MSYAHTLIAAREREENEAADREIECDRLRKDFETEDQWFWLRSVDENTPKGYSVEMIEAKDAATLWKVWARWHSAAEGRYIDQMMDLAHGDIGEPA